MAMTLDGTSGITQMTGSIVMSGSTSGTTTIIPSAVAGTTTVTMPAATGTMMVSGNMPTFSAYQSSAQSISNGTTTKIQFQTEEWDTTSAFDNATNYRFTPLVAGYYQVNGNAVVPQAINNTGLSVAIYKNGSASRWGSSGASNTSLFGRANVSALVYLNGSTDYIELYVIQAFGGTYSLAASSSETYFQAVLVRAA
jgi:hypothetical protein